MFSQKPRCIYRANQFGEVICQLHFLEILTICVHVPAQFQERIRDGYPQYSTRKEAAAPKLTGGLYNFKLEDQADSIFRAAITDTLHDAMGA